MKKEKEKELPAAIAGIFKRGAARLPLIAECEALCTEGPYGEYSLCPEKAVERQMDSIRLRMEYVKRCFPLLSHEFMLAVAACAGRHGRITDLCCGEGWLARWLARYLDRPVAAVDDCSWRFKAWRRDRCFIRMDALEYMKRHPGVDMYILSWPMYDSPLAHRIWRRMREGQELLYIGEDKGGCTANDAFFDDVAGHEVEDAWGLGGSYRRFIGMHDGPVVYRK